ncbi:MAG: hypothetical protein BWX84_02150 [Verrucomicrobia bacterium ADurb.Bin118]|nr:MAG: hypothetical protein BWX84_02150 [Verrucomicrobia bacterium ADurb.Bin118]
MVGVRKNHQPNPDIGREREASLLSADNFRSGQLSFGRQLLARQCPFIKGDIKQSRLRRSALIQ